MRRIWRRGLAPTLVAALLLVGCGDGQGAEESDADGQDAGEATGDEEASDPSPEDSGRLPDSGNDPPDPNAAIEDGMYRGNGVALPVPDGWSIDPAAFQQGIVVAMPEDGAQQLTARALDTDQAGATDAAAMDLEALLDAVRQQVGQDAQADEEVEMAGAEQAHRLTYLQLPAQQEGKPETSATIVVARGADGLVGEFLYSAVAEDYDEDIASRLVDEAGFDPQSEPAELPQAPQPSPDESGGSPAPSGDAG